MSDLLFPFGQPLKKCVQEDQTPKKVFVLGVYSSAVHAKWKQGSKIICPCLAVASEPRIFWDGNYEEAKEIISQIKIPPEVGYLEPADEKFNGPSAKSLEDDILAPLGYTRDDAWLCDLLPESRQNEGQQNRIRESYNPLIEKYGLNPVSVPPQTNNYCDSYRCLEILKELLDSDADLIITLGDPPISQFLNAVSDLSVKKLSEYESKYGYGSITEITILGKKYKYIPMAHPRQIAKLGTYSEKWYNLHSDWMFSKTGRRREIIETGKRMKLTKVQVIKAISDIKFYAASRNENIVFCGPKIGNDDDKSDRLRVYSHGGCILEIGESGITTLNREYGKYVTGGIETADKISRLSDEELLEWISDGRYLDYAVKAANNKFTDVNGMPKERNVQTQILQKYQSDPRKKWFIFDMEFISPDNEKWSKITGKPDFVCFDGESFGVIELKYQNKSVDNLEKHYSDFMTIIDNQDLLTEEMMRRLAYLSQYDIIDKTAVERAIINKNNPVWMGFIFVNENERKTAAAKRFLIPRLQKCGSNFRYMCVESVDAIGNWDWK